MSIATRQPEDALVGSNGEDELSERAAAMLDAKEIDTQFQTYQILVGTSPTLIANQPDQNVTVEMLGALDCFLGNNAVTITTGLLLPGTKGKAVQIKTKGDIYAVAAVAVLVCVVVGAEVNLTN